ncbi:MAG: FAD-dependent oxidoreductase [Alkalicoccus sp.]|nr:MAG: FAD-dependent oxidoreductase [Alkalicoccus sp.]
MKKIIVIGSGYGGVTAAALLQKSGCSVTLLEAAVEWGGCAGKFQRKKFVFPVGATLAMGLNNESIHGKINRFLGINLEAFRLSTVMDVTVDNETINYFSNKETFLQMWKKKLPASADKIEAFFREVWHLSTILQKHMKEFPVIYPHTYQETTALLRGMSWSSLRLLPLRNKSFKYMLDKHDLTEEYMLREFLDNVLMDSLQTTSDKCSLLMGAAALDIYHEDAWYIEGGHYRLIEKMIESIKDNGGQVLKPRKAEDVQKKGKTWIVKDHRGNVHEADHVILNMPLSNAEGLLSEKDRLSLKKKLRHAASEREQWGAFSLYFGIKDVMGENAPLFQQFSAAANSWSESSHFFVSASAPEDRHRAPEGHRSLTISTHVDIKNWSTKEMYDQKSSNLKQQIKNRLEKAYPGFQDSVVYEITGGPSAWERFTSRKNGGVGGFPQIPGYALTNAVSHRSGIKGLWICGDTVFPGAGSIGAASSGVHTARSILKRRIL